MIIRYGLFHLDTVAKKRETETKVAKKGTSSKTHGS